LNSGRLDSKALSTPAVRHMAKLNGLDINAIPATGKNGRVTKEDVINFMEGGSKSSVVASPGSPQQSHAVPAQPALTGTT